MGTVDSAIVKDDPIQCADAMCTQYTEDSIIWRSIDACARVDMVAPDLLSARHRQGG